MKRRQVIVTTLLLAGLVALPPIPLLVENAASPARPSALAGANASLGSVAQGAHVLVPAPAATPLSEASVVSTPALALIARLDSAPGPAILAAPPEAPAPFYEPAGCRAPPDDYKRVLVNGWWLNRRTLAMLQYAAHLYGGPIDVAGGAITHGSYSGQDLAGVDLGSHLGGGAVDLSVTLPNMVQPLYVDIDPLIRALRVAGFAAWLRDRSELFVGADIHIHAIAIGDAELSPQAAQEVTGPFGYFHGLSGAPDPAAVAISDPYGGPVVCQWMLDDGYADLRPAAQRAARPADWQEKLKQAANAYVANSVAETYQVAYRLDWLPGNVEDPSTMCGPLAAAILRDAGLLPPGIGPLNDLKNFWLAKPRDNGRPWSFFSPQEYELFRFDTPLSSFDFAAWPLRPADFVYTYQWLGGYEHMFVVTEVDARGRAFTVTNYRLPSGSFMVQRVMLYDPSDPQVGALKLDWVKDSKIGRTGTAGFDVLRQRGITLPAGSRYSYRVEPGDTLPAIVARFNSRLEAVVADNQLASGQALSVGQRLALTVGFSGQGSQLALAPEPAPSDHDLPYDLSALAQVTVKGATNARVRDLPNGSQVVAVLTDGTPVQVLYGRAEAGGFTWLQVRLASGLTGWMANTLLRITFVRPGG